MINPFKNLNNICENIQTISLTEKICCYFHYIMTLKALKLDSNAKVMGLIPFGGSVNAYTLNATG